jgi:hypothetical protein
MSFSTWISGNLCEPRFQSVIERIDRKLDALVELMDGTHQDENWCEMTAQDSSLEHYDLEREKFGIITLWRSGTMTETQLARLEVWTCGEMNDDTGIEYLNALHNMTGESTGCTPEDSDSAAKRFTVFCPTNPGLRP